MFKKSLLIGDALTNLQGNFEQGTQLRRIIFEGQEFVIGLLKQGSVVEEIDYITLIHAIREHRPGIVSNKKSYTTDVIFFVYDLNAPFLLANVDMLESIPEAINEVSVLPDLFFRPAMNVFISNKEKVTEIPVEIKVNNEFDGEVELPLECIKQVNINNEYVSYEEGLISIDYDSLINELADPSSVINKEQKMVEISFILEVDEKEFQIESPLIIDLDYIDRNKEMEAIRDEELLTNMLANIDMFEMMMSIMPVTLSDEVDYTPYMNIINLYASLIRKDKKSIDDVPAFLRDKVNELI